MNKQGIFVAIILIALMLMSTAFAFLPFSRASTVSYEGPIIDPNSNSMMAFGNGGQQQLSVVTHFNNELVYLSVTYDQPSTATVSGNGLTWNNRANVLLASNTEELSTYWAIVPTPTTVSILVTFSGGFAASSTAISIVGVNIANPFDGAITGRTNTGTTIPATATITTSHNNDLIIGELGDNVGAISQTPVAGASFTRLVYASAPPININKPTSAAENMNAQTPQTALAVTFTGLSSGTGWGMVADAFQGPSVSTCDITGTSETAFSAGDNIYVNGAGFSPSATYTLYVVPDVSSWTNGMTIPTRTTGTATSVTTDSSGNIATTNIYTNALASTYDAVIDINGNGKYDAGVDVLCNSLTTNTAIFTVNPVFVAPEYAYGALIALVVCFAAFGLFYSRKNQKNKNI
jgi:hypothetical protein